MKTSVERFEEIFAGRAEEIRARLVKMTRELVAVPTVNVGRGDLHLYPYLKAPGQESLACEVLGPWLTAMGIPYEVYEGGPMRGNLLGKWGSGGPVLLVALHLDVVPPGKEEEWGGKHPFEVVEEAGRLIGRGVMDNKGPLAAVLAAIWAMKEAGIELKGTLQIAGIASEEYHEAGELDPGVGYLLEKGLLKPDMALIPDVGENMKIIDVAEKGRICFRLEVEGKDGHASIPHRLNSNALMGEVLHALNGFEFGVEANGLLGEPTMSIGILRGGEAANTIPKVCQAWVDVRYVPGQTSEAIRAQLLEVAEGALKAWGAGGSVRLVVESDAPPHEMDSKHLLVGALLRASEGVLPEVPAVIGIGGGTFAKRFNLAGIPSVGFGPGDDDQFHVAGESVSVDELVLFARVAGRLFCDLLA